MDKYFLESCDKFEISSDNSSFIAHKGDEMFFKQVTMSKEEFVTCYNTWIKNIKTSEDDSDGYWVDHYYPFFDVPGIECSKCGKDVPYWNNRYKEPDFCPNCGNRMSGRRVDW